MDIFNIQNLISEGKIVRLSDIDPTKAYLQLGVFQNGNREKGASNANTYESYAIPISELIPGGGGGGCEVHTITSAEAQILVSSDGVIPCDIYVITGVDVNLYGGTTIIVRGEDTNHFTSEGYGLFFNPKYDVNDISYGIYAPFTTFTLSADPLTPFIVGENIQADNGATAIMIGLAFTGMTCYMFVTGGDWTTATTVTGQSSGATAPLSLVTVKMYNPGDQVIWGGRLWTSINGVSSFFLDQFNLNPGDWDVVPYNIFDYNTVLDPIMIDQTTGTIISRTEVAVGNKVSTTPVDMAIMGGDNPIRGFQWGNPFTIAMGPVGVGGNVVDRSYFENINWSTKYCYGNTLEDDCSIKDVITIDRPGFQGNNFKSASKMWSGAMINSNINTCEFYKTNFLNNVFQGGQSHDSHQFYRSHFAETDFSSNYILDCGFSYNFLRGGNFLNNEIIRGSFIECEFSMSNFQENVLLDSYYSKNNHFEGVIFSYNQFLLNVTFQYNTLTHTQFSQNLIGTATAMIENKFESSTFTNNQLTSESFFSYNDIDSTGVSNNIFDQNSSFYQNIFHDSIIDDNNLTLCQIYANIFTNQSSLQNCLGDRYQMFNNYASESSIIRIRELGSQTILHNNRLTQTSSIDETIASTTRVVFTYNTLSNRSIIGSNTYLGVADIQIMSNNLDNVSRISENVIESGLIQDNYLNENSSIRSNQFLNFSTVLKNRVYNNSHIDSCNIAGGQIVQNFLDQESRIEVFGFENTYVTVNRLTQGSSIIEARNTNNVVNINGNILEMSCTIYNNDWVLNAGINNNRLYSTSRINDNTLDDGVIYDNTLSNISSIINNSVNGEIAGNILNSDCLITTNTILIGSLINENVLTRDCRIDSNIIQQAYINSNVLEINSRIFLCQFYHASIYFNRLSSSEMSINAQDPTGANQSEIAFNDLTQNSKILETNTPLQVMTIIYNVLMNAGSIQGNIWINDGEISRNVITQDSGISGNSFDSGLITGCTLEAQSQILSCVFDNGSTLLYVRLFKSNINAMSLTTNTFTISNYDLVNSYLDSWTVVSGSTVSNNVTFTNITITGATLLPNSFTIYEQLPEFVNNAAALLGNLTFGARYRITGTGSVQIVI
jgi:hypothetical protein